MKVFQDNNVLNVGVRTEFHYQNKLLAAISFFSDKDVYVRSILCIPKVPFTYMYRFFVCTQELLLVVHVRPITYMLSQKGTITQEILLTLGCTKATQINKINSVS